MSGMGVGGWCWIVGWEGWGRGEEGWRGGGVDEGDEG